MKNAIRVKHKNTMRNTTKGEEPDGTIAQAADPHPAPIGNPGCPGSESP